MTIKPVADRVLIKTVEAEETTQSGILLAAAAFAALAAVFASVFACSMES